jgi:hypothetical protein
LPGGNDSHVGPVAVDTRGRIILAGYIGEKHSSLVVGRLLPDGRQDENFGEGGWIITPVPDSFEVKSTAATIDPQGRLLVAAGVTAQGQHENGYLLARFLLGLP